MGEDHPRPAPFRAARPLDPPERPRDLAADRGRGDRALEEHHAVARGRGEGALDAADGGADRIDGHEAHQQEESEGQDHERGEEQGRQELARDQEAGGKAPRPAGHAVEPPVTLGDVHRDGPRDRPEAPRRELAERRRDEGLGPPRLRREPALVDALAAQAHDRMRRARGTSAQGGALHRDRHSARGGGLNGPHDRVEPGEQRGAPALLAHTVDEHQAERDGRGRRVGAHARSLRPQ
ncbi:MAG TPA: hypothetical protein VHC93_04065 [Methylomirabilota bacterium]|nr:hypothetical protein [Methylomirabilota bacterium]